MKLKMIALAGLTAASLASAQTQPARPAAKPAAKPAAAAPAAAPAADGKTLSFAAGSGTGPILTKEELRVCLAQEESLRTRLAEGEARRPPLNQEKDAITAEQAALRAERAPIDDFKRQADEFKARMDAHTRRVEAWNQRVQEFNASPPSGPAAERRRTELNKEREEIEKSNKEFDAERTRLQTDSAAAVAAYNAKAQALDTKVSDWNARNQKANDDARALEAERQGWVDTCANRRYREDDEIAIKRGK